MKLNEKLVNVLKLKRVFIPISLISIIGIFLIYLFFGPIAATFRQGKAILYSDAIKEFEILSQKDNSSVNDKCKSILLNHGKKSSKSIILYHGFTNCPEQFRDLGQEFFNLGYNVLIPRIPYHGLKDRLTTEISKLTPQDLTDFIYDTSKIASGLGEEVYTMGISGGGVLAAASGYHNDFVQKAIIISPLLIAYDLPIWGLGPFVKIRSFMPDYYRWWDETTKEKISGPDYAYPQFSFKASMSFTEISYKLMLDIESSDQTINKDLKIVHIYSENDIAVKNDFNRKIMREWGKKLESSPQEYMFPASFNFNHDIIDKNQATARPDIVYPKIIELTEQ